MSAFAILWIPESGGDSLRYAVCDDASGALIDQGAGDLERINGEIERLGAASVFVLVPGERVMSRRAAAPGKTSAAARVAAPFVLEDDAAADVADLHFAVSGADAERRRLILGAARDDMDLWMSVAAGLEAPVGAVLPDYCVLGARIGEAVAAADGARGLVQFGDGAGFASEADLAGDLMAELGREHGAASVTVLRGAQTFRERIETALGDDGSALDEADEDIFGRFGRVLAGGAPIDMRQGAYAPRRNWAAMAAPWRLAAALALVLLGANAVLLVAEGAVFHRQADQFNARAADLYRAAFPQEAAASNVRAEMRAKLGGRAVDDSVFLHLSTVLAETLGDVDTVSVSSVRYDEGLRELQMELIYQSYDDVERLKAAIARRGGDIEEGGFRRVDNAIVGAAVVRAR